jgi:predicted RNA-binding protein (virulence factor B family)
MQNKKRYIAVVDFYIYAESDQDAFNQAQQIAKDQDSKNDDWAKVIELHKELGIFVNQKLDLKQIEHERA